MEPVNGYDGQRQSGTELNETSAAAGSLQVPNLTLPKGGGAIRGIGEKFAANPVTGTGSMSVPIATSPGRSGFGPQLSLSYDSGAGNGPFGFGWSLSLPSITRKTDKGLPQYQDAVDSDVFILSGAEDLVPVYRQDPDGSWVARNAGYSRDPDPFWVRDPAGYLVIHEDELAGYRVRRYRPRIEGLFARIERWSKIGSPSDVHWRSISKDNILTLYGLDAESRIADPLDASRIFIWLICETRDDKGNAVLYRYKGEDGVGVDLGDAHERNRGSRDDDSRKANRYLKRIHYGNRTSLIDPLTGQRPRILTQAQIDGAGWMFEVVFDYGEHDARAPTPNDAGVWLVRSDPFSSYRAGFEVRTARLCRRVLMFHHIPDPATDKKGYEGLVRSTDFSYPEELDPANPNRIDPISVEGPVYTFLKAVTQTGYRRNNGGYDPPRSLPPVEFEYTEPKVQDAVEEVDPENLENLPVGLDGSAYRWTDLHGEGIPGILTEQGGAWYYKRNWSPIPNKLPDGSEVVKAKLAPLEAVAVKPNVALAAGAEFMDLAGDGQPDVVMMEGSVHGLYEHDEAEGWHPFRPFTSRLNRDLREPNVKFVDLDGDGHADVLITEDDAFVWHASLAEEGFGPARRVAQALDEEKGPRIVFADGTQSIHLADLSGDGLTDIVRIRNGEVCYWPNLGYCRFGAKVTMDNAPWFDHVDQFDQTRIRLADIDGSGTTDIIYLHRDGVRLYFNQSGNSWSKPEPLNVFPRIDDLASIVPTDLLGNGTACLVWSSPLPGDARRPIRYVNLMGSRKPHLLVNTINNLGAETRVDYAPSTRFYLQDKQEGTPWITRLPFPVHVVERVETHDHISRNRFVTHYAYHHGYFDGEEREFRGFGMVEQWDTEEFATLAGGSLAAENIDAASHVPPVHTKTWFHTGMYLGRDHVSNFFAGLLDARDKGEYYREPGLTDQQAADLGLDDEERRLYDDARAKERLLDDTVLPDGLTVDEEREACRALKGLMLRQEVYADDAEPGASVAQIQRARTPYTVTEQNFVIRALQPGGTSRHAVFFTHAREAINYHYERNPSDPRIQHALTLEVDVYGNVLKQAAVSYGRRQPGTSPPTQADRTKQALVHITSTENAVTNAVTDLADRYRSPLPAESRTYELRKPQQERSTGGLIKVHRFEDLLRHVGQAADGTHDIAYEDLAFDRARQAAADDPAEADQYFRRLIESVRTLYRPDDCGAAQNDPLALLAVRKLESLALPGESYKLAFTPALLAKVFQRRRAGQPNERLLPNAASVLGGTAGNRGGYVDLDMNGHWWVPSGRSFFDSSPTGAAGEVAEARQHFFLPRRYRDPFGHDAFIDFDTPHDLLIVETRDALGNRVTVDANDYRVLQPRLVSDPNRNQTEVAFDALGMVVATAVMSKPTDSPRLGDRLDASFRPDPPQAPIDSFITKPREASADPEVSLATQAAHDLLSNATTRIVYDLDRFRHTRKAHPRDPGRWEPPFAATIARETHVSDLPAGQRSKLQISLSYSDGFGREIQKKIQAEPGLLVEGGSRVNPRWVGSGWTIFNNKGKPVRQYEPFFSATHRFEFGVMVGVSSVLFYDPVERVIATLHPNHTYAKVVFDPWQQTTYDVNDTVLDKGGNSADPKNDPDMAGFFKRLPDAEYLPTWHGLRTLPQHAAAFDQRYPDPNDRKKETTAAAKAVAHAGTPITAHFDALGRPFLTVARNRTACAGHDLDGTEDSFAIRTELDIEGNQREVRDERKLPVGFSPTGPLEQRVVMRYAYDMLGNRIHQSSMEAGARWMLNDVAGKSIRAWDSRNHEFIHGYDALRRPTDTRVKGGDGTAPLNHVYETFIYGEGQSLGGATDQALNLRRRLFVHYDTAGKVRFEEYDFKGNPRKSRRRLAADYRRTPHWSVNDPDSLLEVEDFLAETEYDALSRPTRLVTPDGSVARPQYNEASLLNGVGVRLRGASNAETRFVINIDYDSKGQRTRIDYGNGATTRYGYDPLTFRLARLSTTRPANLNGLASQLFKDNATVQNLRYTYDPIGNITEIADDALPTITHSNAQLDPVCRYTYDALYRLVEARGREHVDQSAFLVNPPKGNYRDYPFAGAVQPSDPRALRNYTEQYVYDAVGNFQRMIHQAANGGWTRTYAYNEASQLEDLKTSNRLTSTTIGTTATDLYSTNDDGYDPHGNMLRMPHLPLMRWDFHDQLQATAQQVVNNGGAPETTWYVYDAAGQRVRKVTESAVSAQDAAKGTKPARLKERIYVGGFEIYREYATDGKTVSLARDTLHISDGKQRVALVETKTPESGLLNRLRNFFTGPETLIRYQFGNHLGSACLELDDQSRIISYEEYAPYGRSTYQAVRSHTETPKRYRYTGKERDEETGFGYHTARYHAPWLARWISCDPAGLHEGVNPYAYVNGRPTELVDMHGHAGGKPSINQSVAPPQPQARYAFDTYANQSKIPQGQRVGGTNLQGHHPYQVAWAKHNVAGFSKEDAISQFLETKGAPTPANRGEHTKISVDQRANRPASGDWSEKTFSQMRSEAVSQYENAGLMTDAKQGKLTLEAADGQFFEVNDTPLVDPKTNKPMLNELGVQEVSKTGAVFEQNLANSNPGQSTPENIEAIVELPPAAKPAPTTPTDPVTAPKGGVTPGVWPAVEGVTVKGFAVLVVHDFLMMLHESLTEDKNMAERGYSWRVFQPKFSPGLLYEGGAYLPIAPGTEVKSGEGVPGTYMGGGFIYWGI
jgi:RHS repeat-associated protein